MVHGWINIPQQLLVQHGRNLRGPGFGALPSWLTDCMMHIKRNFRSRPAPEAVGTCDSSAYASPCSLAHLSLLWCSYKNKLFLNRPFSYWRQQSFRRVRRAIALRHWMRGLVQFIVSHVNGEGRTRWNDIKKITVIFACWNYQAQRLEDNQESGKRKNKSHNSCDLHIYSPKQPSIQ